MVGKKFEIVVDADKSNIESVQKFCSQLDGFIKRWAYILHDKDECRGHYHIYLDFGDTKVSSAMVSWWFDIDAVFIEKLKNNVKPKDFLRYLIHDYENQRSKHQYAPSEIVANFDVKEFIVAS